MLVTVDQATSPEADEDQNDDQCDGEPTEVVDPSTLPPLFSEAEFSELVAGIVAEEAPRLFAVVQEYGERVDGEIAAWGMAFGDHAEVVFVDGASMNVRSPERAVQLLSHRPHVTARLVWVHPDAAGPPDETDAA